VRIATKDSTGRTSRPSGKSLKPGMDVFHNVIMLRESFEFTGKLIGIGITIIALAFPNGALARTSDPVSAMGYAQTNVGRPLVVEALNITNSILASSSSQYKLAKGWARRAESTTISKEIAVFLIAPTSEPFVIQVPFRSCHCLFIQSRAFHKSLGAYAGRLKQMMHIEPAHMLAFMMLHEMGHVQSGDPGAFDDEAPEFNLTETEQKKRERSADEFAARALMAAAKDTKSTVGFLNAMKVQLALANASWNLAAVRLLNNFGASVLCSKPCPNDAGSAGRRVGFFESRGNLHRSASSLAILLGGRGRRAFISRHARRKVRYLLEPGQAAVSDGQSLQARWGAGDGQLVASERTWNHTVAERFAKVPILPAVIGRRKG
jgi:hypothetical protein